MKCFIDYEKGESFMQFTSKELREGLSASLDLDLLMNIVAYMDVKTMTSNPSQDLLAKNMGLSTASVNRRVSEILEKHPEIITRELKRSQKNYKAKYSIYHLNLDVEKVMESKQINKAFTVHVPTAQEIAEQEEYEKRVAEWLAKED